ncbi:MAG: translation elongation factor Ts [Gammaproteobacteria bacterium]|tara:strand:- start:111 stop:968 length:858 start_codon:yes stop_codon:yes gene_type:complete
MSNISASQVKELREKTGLGLMDCKKALEESQGDMELAIEELRKTSGIKASKKSGRSAADGLIAIKSQDDQYFMIEVNCETDFVARDDSFVEFTSQTLDSYVSNPESSLEEILANGAEDSREKIVQKLGENIVIRRIAKTNESSVTGSYLHSNQKIGCIVSLEGGDESLANDIAMHASATDPMAVTPSDIPTETVEKEREIFRAQSEGSGKPPEIVEKMIEGKVAKFLSEVSLTEQDFVKDPNMKISQLLKENNANILNFIRYEVGEGIEVEKVDFATEVMSQIEG